MKRAIGRKRRENEAKILAAAEKVFAERGFAAATTSAIARLAGMPKANLHYYFRTKEALYTRVLDEILALWIETAEAIRPEADPKAALSAYIAAKIDFSRSRPQASKVFANEILHGAPRVRRRLKGDLNPLVINQAAHAQPQRTAVSRAKRVTKGHGRCRRRQIGIQVDT